MPTRRDFLGAMAAGLGASTALPVSSPASGKAEIRTVLNGPVGLQLWSLREYLPKDLAGTLAKVRAFGFREVEGAGLWGRSASELKAALDAAGLRCTSAHMGFERLRDDLPGALAEAKALGSAWVVCPWIPHDKEFAREDALRAAEAFNRFGKGAREAGLQFGYHCHGYEFVPSPEGTLWDTLVGATDPATVAFQMDLFHAYHGGADLIPVMEKLKGRIPSLHLKDLKKGFPIEPGSPGAPPEADVPVGTGQIDYPAALRTAMKAGASAYYVEDESKDPLGNIPKSVTYLEGLKL
jgi:sugar phosphate isomerase/epimerase